MNIIIVYTLSILKLPSYCTLNNSTVNHKNKSIRSLIDFIIVCPNQCTLDTSSIVISFLHSVRLG